MSEEYAAIFKEEASELLEELEAAILEWEENLDDLKIVGRIFRAMHTIKGSGAMFGFDEIAEFTHHVETALDKVREGTIAGSKELIELVFASRDHIASLLDAATGEGAVEPGSGDKIIESLKKMVVGVTDSSIEPPPPTDDEEDELEEAEEAERKEDEHAVPTFFRISFKPNPDFFASGGNSDSIIADLRQLGELEITGQSEGLAEEYAAGKAAYWDMLLSTNADINEIKDIFIFAENTSKITITELGDDDVDSFPQHQRLGDILVEKGDIEKDDLENALKEQKPVGELLVDRKLIAKEKLDSALKEQKILTDKRQGKSKPADSLKVTSDKLDHLINLIGEMVVTQARLSEVAAKIDTTNPEFMEPVEEVERLTAELRDCVLNIRMMPIGATFSRYKRLVRDLSKDLGKEVDLVMEGADTELDKSVIDLMSDPLVHLIRNSIDHGVESPKDRLAAGKPRRGTIKLSANHCGANVVIQIIDDGKGIDSKAIRQKAIEKGFITADAELSEDDTFALIFGAGVSSAKKVTDVSGRGVGMDVVKSTIEGRLKGSVKVSSKLNVGTTITITLPLTLAIIDGLLVKVCSTHFVLPLSQVEECVELTSSDIEQFHGRHVFPVRNKLVPYVNLREFFKLSGDKLDLQQMVIVSLNEDRIGVVLDEVIGGHQTVIKSLGWVYRNAEGVSGATILGNGEVALIVDVANLIKHAQSEEISA